MLNYENKINKHLAKFGMTFAKSRTYRAPEICQNMNESTFWQNKGHSEKYDVSTSNLHITGIIDLTKKITTNVTVQNITCPLQNLNFEHGSIITS